MAQKIWNLTIGLSWLSLLNHSNNLKNNISGTHFPRWRDCHTIPDYITWATAALRKQSRKCQIRKYCTTQHARDQFLLGTDHTLATALSVQSPAQTNVIAKPKPLRKQDDWTSCEPLQNILWQYRWIKLLCQGGHCYATSPPTLVRLNIKAKNYFMYLPFYLNSVQAMVTSVMKKLKSNDVEHYDMCIKL